MADMWHRQFGEVDKPAHMREMLTLTTRMNALARATLGNVNIAATTALQVGARRGPACLLARANPGNLHAGGWGVFWDLARPGCALPLRMLSQAL